jgi:hypothetical protein
VGMKYNLTIKDKKMKLSEIIKEKHGLDYSQEINELLMLESLIEMLKKNKLYKNDRERLIEAIEIIKLGEY